MVSVTSTTVSVGAVFVHILHLYDNNFVSWSTILDAINDKREALLISLARKYDDSRAMKPA